MGTSPMKQTGFTPGEVAPGPLEIEYAEYLKELNPLIMGFFEDALGDADYPFSVPEKDLKAVIKSLGAIAVDQAKNVVVQPYDLFKLPYTELMEKAYQSILDFGRNYDTGKYKISRPTTEIAKPDRAALGKYESDIGAHLKSLTTSGGYAVNELAASFRDQVSNIMSQFKQKQQAIYRLASTDPRLRLSNLMELEIAKGDWVQSASDKTAAMKADMRLKAEFFGAENLLKLATLAVQEETSANEANFTATQLSLNKDQLRTEADRIAAEVGMRADAMKLSALESGAAGLLGVGKAQEEVWLNTQNLKTTKEQLGMQKQQNLLGVLATAQSLFQYGKDYPLRAVGGAVDYASAGMNAAVAKYNADISKWSGTSYAQSSPPIWASLLGAGISGATSGLGAGIGAGAGKALFGTGATATASDRRLKENIERIGKLDSGLPVYRFNYIGEDTVRIGVIAQEVEAVQPEAVVEVAGFKAVRYDLIR